MTFAILRCIIVSFFLSIFLSGSVDLYTFRAFLEMGGVEEVFILQHFTFWFIILSSRSRGEKHIGCTYRPIANRLPLHRSGLVGFIFCRTRSVHFPRLLAVRHCRLCLCEPHILTPFPNFNLVSS